MTEIKKIEFEDIKLDEEIKKNGKIIENGVNNVPKPNRIFLSNIPYKECRIILTGIIMPSVYDILYYTRSKYGWWNFCAKKDELDELDKKLIDASFGKYGQYREDDDLFCFDNQHSKEDSGFNTMPFNDLDYYNLHPNKIPNRPKGRGIFDVTD